MSGTTGPATLDTTSGDAVLAPVRRSTVGEDRGTLLVSLWLTAGLFLDGYAHDHLLTGKESFFTPWHAVFYSGFAATVAWLGLIVSRRLAPPRPMWSCLPVGYRSAGVGVAVFAFGGVGDALWHTRFGFERSDEALFSPTHLLLFAGLVLIVSAPFRAASALPSGRIVQWSQFWLPMGSLVLTTAIVAFFSVWGLASRDLLRVRYDVATGSGEAALLAGVASELVATVILMSAVLIVVRRWQPPSATFTLLFTTVAAAFALAFSGETQGVFAAFAGGVVVDLALAAPMFGRMDNATTRTASAAALGPVAMWSMYHLLLHSSGDLAWSAPLAAGTPILAGLTGLGLFALTNAPPRTERVS